jgi:hypothetical protein
VTVGAEHAIGMRRTLGHRSPPSARPRARSSRCLSPRRTLARGKSIQEAGLDGAADIARHATWLECALAYAREGGGYAGGNAPGHGRALMLADDAAKFADRLFEHEAEPARVARMVEHHHALNEEVGRAIATRGRR